MSTKRILFLTDNFPPEVNAPATRTLEHAREWVKKGHDVTYHILEDQGHQIWDEDERTNLLVYVDNFLMRCMPPRPVPSTSK